MKNKIPWFLSVMAIIAFCKCKQAEEMEDVSNLLEYEIDGSARSYGILTANIFEDQSILLNGYDLVLEIEHTTQGEYFLNQNSYTTASCYPESSDKQYSANVSNIVMGSIIVTDFDEGDLSISGVFSFETKYKFGNLKTIVGNGKFENVLLIRQDGYYKDGKIEAEINGEKIKYTDVRITDSIEFIRVHVYHPNKNQITLQIPNNLATGIYPIQESDLIFKDEIVFWFDRELGNGLTCEYPIENCFLEVEEMNFENKIFKGNLTGIFSNKHPLDAFYEEQIITKFKIDLNWN